MIGGIKFLLIAGLFLHLHFLVLSDDSVPQKNDKDICYILGHNETFEVFLAGNCGYPKKRLSHVSHLLLITRNTDGYFQVYDMRQSQIHQRSASSNLHLNKMLSKPLEIKYPKLYEHPVFQKLKGRPFSQLVTFTAWDKYNYLMIYQQPPEVSLQYNIDTGNVTEITQPSITIPASGSPVAFIQVAPDRLMQFSSDAQGSTLTAYHFANGSLIPSANAGKEGIRFCPVDSQNIQEVYSGENCKQPAALNWTPIRHGWRLGLEWIFFADAQVYTVYGTRDPDTTQVATFTKAYSDFFQCSPDSVPTASPVTKGSGTLGFILIGVLILVLFILLLIILFCTFCKSKNQEQISITTGKSKNADSFGSQPMKATSRKSKSLAKPKSLGKAKSLAKSSVKPASSEVASCKKSSIAAKSNAPSSSVAASATGIFTSAAASMKVASKKSTLGGTSLSSAMHSKKQPK